MSAAEPPTIHKPTFFEELLKNCRVVAVSVDTSRRSMAILPRSLFANPTCSLHYGLNLPKDIPDLRIDGGGIYATLSFGQESFATFVPWSAIWRMEGDTGEGLVQHVWYEDIPVELVRQVRETGAEQKLTEAASTLPPLSSSSAGREDPKVSRERRDARFDAWGRMAGPGYEGPTVGTLVPGEMTEPETPPRGKLVGL